METFLKLTELKGREKRLTVALGMFDGVHVGHESIIRRAVELARAIGGKALVFTFSNHPLETLAPGRVPLQIGNSLLKEKRCQELGADYLMSIPFTRKLAALSPEDFLRLLEDSFAPRYVVAGANFTFGERGRGTQRMLLRSGAAYGFQAEICPTVECGGRAVSSTRIRELIRGGDLAAVNELLGYPYTVLERVAHGDRRGRRLGFPTANLTLSPTRAALPAGVYAAYAEYEGKKYAALANIGVNPTFTGERAVRLEVNLQGFNRDIYDQVLSVSFLARLRGEKKFASADDLVRQMQRDRAEAARFWELV